MSLLSLLWCLMFLSPKTKPKCAMDHNGNRKKVCAPCGRKFTGRIITPAQESTIKKFINKEFSLDDERFPVAMCDRCRKSLLNAERGKIIKLIIQILFMSRLFSLILILYSFTSTMHFQFLPIVGIVESFLIYKLLKLSLLK